VYADDVLRRQATLVEAFRGDPDIAVFVEYGDVSAGGSGEPAVIDAAHHGGDLLSGRLSEEFHNRYKSLSVCSENDRFDYIMHKNDCLLNA